MRQLMHPLRVARLRAGLCGPACAHRGCLSRALQAGAAGPKRISQSWSLTQRAERQRRHLGPGRLCVHTASAAAPISGVCLGDCVELLNLHVFEHLSSCRGRWTPACAAGGDRHEVWRLLSRSQAHPAQPGWHSQRRKRQPGHRECSRHLLQRSRVWLNSWCTCPAGSRGPHSEGGTPVCMLHCSG